jgi:hypothetical protein
MRTLAVNEVEEVSGGIVWFAVAAYLGSKVTVTGVALGVGAGVGFVATLVALSD